jgi:nitrate reductase NapD
MPISGIVIKCQPGRATELATTLHRPGAVEIHQVVDPSTLVAVIEALTVSDEVDLTKDLLAVDGVITVQLAYHNFEDVAS